MELPRNPLDHAVHLNASARDVASRYFEAYDWSHSGALELPNETERAYDVSSTWQTVDKSVWNAGKLFAAADADHDARVTPQELVATLTTFERDGIVSADLLRAAQLAEYGYTHTITLPGYLGA